MAIEKTEKQIEDQLYKAKNWTSQGATDVSGMTYEDGVEAALNWVLGQQPEEPIENDYEDNDE